MAHPDIPIAGSGTTLYPSNEPNAVTHGRSRAASTNGTPSTNGLAALPDNGHINEDVMQQIWDISRVPLPLTDMIGSTTAKNAYKEWVRDKLQDPTLDETYADGADVTDVHNAGGDRVGNHCQINAKRVVVSSRARSADTIGRSDELSYQVTRRQQELRRNVEATMLSSQGSQADDGAIGATKGKSAGLGAWIVTNRVANGATGGGYGTTSPTLVDKTAQAASGSALTESDVRDVCQMIYEEGGDASVFMSTPAVVRKFSEYLFTSSARVATLISDQGKSASPATALGTVDVFVHDFGVLKLHPNRLQLLEDDGSGGAKVANAYILDPSYLSQAILRGYRTEPLAKTGLADKRLMSVDWTLVVNTELAQGVICSIDPSAAVVAG